MQRDAKDRKAITRSGHHLVYARDERLGRMVREIESPEVAVSKDSTHNEQCEKAS